MFAQSQIVRVGAARFGDRSCTGASGFPHSTVYQTFAELGLVGGGTLLALLLLAGTALARQNRRDAAATYALALFVAFLVADQIYGNLFMASGTYLLLGLAAGTLAEIKRESVAHG